MIRSAVTVSLVPEARGGPFVFWDDLPAACRRAKELGFDAIELFAPSPQAVPQGELKKLLDDQGLKLAAVGTGAGWLKHQLRLTGPEPSERSRARQFVRAMVDYGGPLGAPAIIGSMQGRWGGDVSRDTALKYLAEALNDLGEHARQYSIPLIYEPLNRYETTLINTLAAGVELLGTLGTNNVRLLGDLFHMNIEETDLATAIRGAQSHLGHVHFVDSNRRPAGYGHLEYAPIAEALCAVGYEGYASAEALPWPSPDEAASQTIAAFKTWFPRDKKCEPVSGE
ncbi:MAG TPA: sugar phosphate isomerase/epimerase family protein [Pirellulales bacterium]|jgi:sugar phosphate isomerase/epimerase|nr:sugar phosphate isomerase/epimerase family protein [Pirellulales bacterium]